MKKNLFAAIMSCLLFIGLTSMVSLSPPVTNQCSEDCAFLESIGLFPQNHGACMSACNTCTSNGKAHHAVCFCKITKDVLGGLEANGFENMGQCVTTLNNIPPTIVNSVP